MLACRSVDVDLDVTISFHIGTAVPGQDRVNPIELSQLIETINVVVDMDRRTAVENKAIRQRIARGREGSILDCK